MTYKDIIDKATDTLRAAGVLNPEVDAWELFSEVFGMKRKDYLVQMLQEAESEGQAKYDRLVAVRRTRKPLQHILGHTGFMGLDFFVDERVLCPRQDTEILVEEALRYLEPHMSVLDLCTGSGCVLISLLHYGKEIEGTGADISAEALKVATENARRNYVHPVWKQGDLFEAVGDARFDIIVSNPPYIPTDVISGLMPEVRDHEPLMALDGGVDGLDYYRRITKEAPHHINNEGWLLFEIGVDDKIAVESILFEQGFSDIHCVKDYADNDRVVAGQYICM